MEMIILFILLEEFLQLVYEYTNNIKVYPTSTDVFMYDKRFSPDWLVDYLKQLEIDDRIYQDGGYCFEYIFNEFEEAITRLKSNHFDSIWHVCNSNDINESYPGGDYDYYAGIVIEKFPFIYDESSHEFEYPSRLTIYGQDITIEMRRDSTFVDLYETVHRVRDLFFIKNKKNKIEAIKKFLKNTDRPVEYEMSNRISL